MRCREPPNQLAPIAPPRSRCHETGAIVQDRQLLGSQTFLSAGLLSSYNPVTQDTTVALGPGTRLGVYEILTLSAWAAWAKHCFNGV